MTEKEIILIKRSWRLLQGVNSALIGDVFYTKLFNETPSLRKLFPKEMEGQQVKLIEMLNYIVTKIDKIDKLIEDITAMAKRHIDYGAKPIHYQKVGEALLWTLEKGLGNDWNEPLASAWQNCYKLLSKTMLAVEK